MKLYFQLRLRPKSMDGFLCEGRYKTPSTSKNLRLRPKIYVQKKWNLRPFLRLYIIVECKTRFIDLFLGSKIGSILTREIIAIYLTKVRKRCVF